ncbi:hypothetical protein L9F63_022476 [Diploptera punctata]|uniref:Cathepsin L n=1 Tax=Diploptera punctata TaxID=6984 RepID=A0AAD7ZMN3_DIPPU|nr:hypothetical protein L9F63_022476 [Diploptera punctata]
MKFVIPLLTAVAACYCVAIEHIFFSEWNLYKLQFGKNYESRVEEEFRMRVFLENRHLITKHNTEYELGLHTYKLGVNQFSDRLDHELFGMNAIKINREMVTDGATFITPENTVIPDEMDWRTKGAVTRVKNQKMCNSCYAFSATGSLESQQFRKTGKLVSLSEQNIIDCSSKFGNHGCDGGLDTLSFDYIKNNGGIDTEESYPYESRNNGGIDTEESYPYESRKAYQCRYKNETIGAKVTGYVKLPEGDEEKLKEAVATIGPISVGIDSSSKNFFYYKEGE